jgi:hypothetical protein
MTRCCSNAEHIEITSDYLLKRRGERFIIGCRRSPETLPIAAKQTLDAFIQQRFAGSDSSSVSHDVFSLEIIHA